MVSRGYISSREKKQIQKKIEEYLKNEKNRSIEQISTAELNAYVATIAVVNGGQAIVGNDFIKNIVVEAQTIINKEFAKTLKRSVMDNFEEVEDVLNTLLKETSKGKSLTSMLRKEKRSRKGIKIRNGNKRTKTGKVRTIDAGAALERDVRTAVTKAKVEIARKYGETNGLDLFQVSAHSGARELCYPYQGKIISWSGESGTFTDMNGNTIEYIGINDTSYGEPAGLFGINCRHEAYPIDPEYFVDNISETVPSPEENEKQKEIVRLKRKQS